MKMQLHTFSAVNYLTELVKTQETVGLVRYMGDTAMEITLIAKSKPIVSMQNS